MLERPEVAAVSCRECQQFIYGPDWKPIQRHGPDGKMIKMPRPRTQKPPCYMCPKVPDDVKRAARKNDDITPKDAMEWNDQSWQAWRHYWATKSGAGPDQDAYSREICGYLEQVVQLSTRRLHDPTRLTNILAAMLGAR